MSIQRTVEAGVRQRGWRAISERFGERGGDSEVGAGSSSVDWRSRLTVDRASHSRRSSMILVGEDNSRGPIAAPR